MAARTKKLSMVKLNTDRGRYSSDDGRIRDADLVIDHRNTVIKDRHGIASRAATVTEQKNATAINP
jgi:hypothetical protein